ncbi:MAG TPA: CapA family protein [Candidatus Limiplasma sp.]|nr:CapA family protein [Candidatus Limiplasma sp.]
MKRLAGLFFVWMYLLCTTATAWADQTILVSFLGDCTIGCEEKVYEWENGFAMTADREGYAYFFEKVYPLLSTDDLTVANFEGVLKRNAYGKTEKTYNFRGLPAYAQILVEGSVEAVGLENNHTEDYGDTGKNTTKTALTDAGVSWFDAENAYIYEKGGVRIAFLSIWQQWVFYYGKEYEQTITALKKNGADVVVVYLHAGEEYNPYHTESQSSAAYRFIDAGADLIVCSHPHVVQGIEEYQNRLILYSLGNFVFGGNVNVRALETYIPQVTFTFSADGEYLCQQLRVYPANVSGDAEANDYQPRLVTGEAADAVYLLIDQDSETLELPYTTTEDYREYNPVYAAADENN